MISQPVPTGNTLNGGRDVEVYDSAMGPEYKYTMPYGHYLANTNEAYGRAHPDEMQRPYTQTSMPFQLGQGLQKSWRGIQSSDLGSNVVGGLMGAAGGLGASYLADMVGARLGFKPLGPKARLLAALLGSGVGAYANNYYRHSDMQKASNAWPGAFDPGNDQLLRELSVKVMTSPDLDMGTKAKVMQVLNSLNSPELAQLARIAATAGGFAAGRAIARFLFGDSFLPAAVGGFLGGYSANSFMTPSFNAMGNPHL